MDLRTDIDTLVDHCAISFSEEALHYIDYPPGLSPSASETPSGKSPSRCVVDREGAREYLGALRDDQIWPSTCWGKSTDGNGGDDTVGNLVDKIKAFRVPVYDDADRCTGCVYVKERFTEELERIKESHAKRLWGLCLDCYKTGGVDPASCRYEHLK